MTSFRNTAGLSDKTALALAPQKAPPLLENPLLWPSSVDIGRASPWLRRFWYSSRPCLAKLCRCNAWHETQWCQHMAQATDQQAPTRVTFALSGWIFRQSSQSARARSLVKTTQFWAMKTLRLLSTHAVFCSTKGANILKDPLFNDILKDGKKSTQLQARLPML